MEDCGNEGERERDAGADVVVDLDADVGIDTDADVGIDIDTNRHRWTC